MATKKRGRFGTTSIASSPMAEYRAKARQAAEEAHAANRRRAAALFRHPQTGGNDAGRPAEPARTEVIASPTARRDIGGEPTLYYWARMGMFDKQLRDRHIILEGPLTEDDAAVVTVHGLRAVYDELRDHLRHTKSFSIPDAHRTVLAMESYTTAEGYATLKRTYNEVAGQLGRQTFDITGVVDYTPMQLPETVAAQQA